MVFTSSSARTSVVVRLGMQVLICHLQITNSVPHMRAEIGEYREGKYAVAADDSWHEADSVGQQLPDKVDGNSAANGEDCK